VDHHQLTDQLLAELHTLQNAKLELTEDLTMQRDIMERDTTQRDTEEEDQMQSANLEQSENVDHHQLTDQPLAELHTLQAVKPEDNLLEEDTEEEDNNTEEEENITISEEHQHLNQSMFNQS